MSNKAIEVCGNDPVYTKPDVPCNCTEIYEDIDQLQEAVVNLEADKQGNLIAGDGIVIEGNRISSTGGGSRLLYTDDAGDHGVVQNDVENNIAGDYALAEGLNNTASGIHSHAEGENNVASGRSAHAEGNANTASGEKAHCEGAHNTSSGDMAHAEGYYTEATQSFAHAEGGYTKAQGYGAHAEGAYSEARADNSHAEGLGTVAASPNQHVSGKYNKIDNSLQYAEIVGNGTDVGGFVIRDDIRTLDWNGNEWIKGKMTAPSGYDIWDSGSSSMIDFAQYILEKYNAVTLAGAARTPKNAIDTIDAVQWTTAPSLTDSYKAAIITASNARRLITIANIAKHIIESYASSTLAGAAQSIQSALTITPVTVQAGTNVTINRQAVYTFGGFCFVSLNFTTSATITGSSNLMTGFPKPAALTDMPFIRGNATPYHGIVNANGNLRFGASAGGPAAAYQVNGTYRLA